MTIKSLDVGQRVYFLERFGGVFEIVYGRVIGVGEERIAIGVGKDVVFRPKNLIFAELDAAKKERAKQNAKR